jgi:hypothetical protein
MSNAAITRGSLGDLQLHIPSLVEQIRRLGNISWATLSRLLPGLRTDANARLETIAASSIEDVALLEAASRADFEFGKRNVDVTDQLLRVSLIGIGKMD